MKFLYNYELGNPMYILMFAGIGCAALAAIALVIVACVKKSRSPPLSAKYISMYPYIEELYRLYNKYRLFNRIFKILLPL